MPSPTYDEPAMRQRSSPKDGKSTLADGHWRRLHEHAVLFASLIFCRRAIRCFLSCACDSLISGVWSHFCGKLQLAVHGWLGPYLAIICYYIYRRLILTPRGLVFFILKLHCAENLPSDLSPLVVVVDCILLSRCFMKTTDR